MTNRVSNNLFPDTLRTLAFGSISGTYATVGAVTAHSYDILILSNTTNGGLIVSFDGGTTDHVNIAPNQTLPINAAACSVDGLNHTRTPPIGTQFSVKQSDATTLTVGGFFITGLYEK